MHTFDRSGKDSKYRAEKLEKRKEKKEIYHGLLAAKIVSEKLGKVKDNLEYMTTRNRVCHTCMRWIEMDALD